MSLVQKRRTDRGSRMDQQTYLGTADALLTRLRGPPYVPPSVPFRPV